MVATDYFKKYGAKYEGGLMRKTDAVVANSVFLKENAATFNQKCFLCGPGLRPRTFQSQIGKKNKPNDLLKKIKSPVIGTSGR